MLEAYWNLGRLIFEEEQKGSARAEYAAYLIRDLARRLTQEYGRGYSVPNLKNFRQFYLAFPRDPAGAIGYTLCSQLTWSHYRALMRVANPEARAWYVRAAAAQGWVVRTLLRQIGSFAYERTLKGKRRNSSQPEKPGRKGAALEPREFIKDPYVLEFLDVESITTLQETTLEQAIIGRLQEFMLELDRERSLVTCESSPVALDSPLSHTHTRSGRRRRPSAFRTSGAPCRS